MRAAGSLIAARLFLANASGGSRRRSPVAGRSRALASVGTVWLALVMPGQYSVWGIQDFFRLPVAGIALGGASLVLPRRLARVGAIGFGTALASLVMLRGLNLGFRSVLTRPFDITNDWTYLRAGAETLATYAGRPVAIGAVAGAAGVTAAVFAIVPWACLSLANAVNSRPWRALPAVAAAAIVWRWLRRARIGWPHGYYTAWAASTAMIRMARETVQAIPRNLADRAVFSEEIHSDAAATVPAPRLVAGLAGKDVLIVFLEGLGQVAVDDARVSNVVRPALGHAEAVLAAAGFSAYSAWVDSPTFGAGSWLAHASVEAGMWVNSQRRYNQLLCSDRLTLCRAFGAAGWRTVFVVPSTDRPWPQGRPFYGFDTLYTKFNLGYHGQPYGYATMPDQYLYHAFAQRELRPDGRQPVFAQLDTLSSHYPWTTPPALLPWGQVGDGAAFTGPEPPIGDAHEVYAQTIVYTIDAFAQFVAQADPDNLVVLAMGDHQPNHTVTQRGASHRTPIMLIGAHDVAAPAAGRWGWSDGVTPAPDAPVWRMSAIRDRVFEAFGSPHGTTAPPRGKVKRTES